MVSLRSVALLAILSGLVAAVDRSKFKTCSQSGFCRRHHSKTIEPEIRLTTTPKLTESDITATASSVDSPGIPLTLRVSCYSDGATRVRLDERDLPARWKPEDVVLEDGLSPVTPSPLDASSAEVVAAKGGAAVGSSTFFTFTTAAPTSNTVLVEVQGNPLVVRLYVNGRLELTVNDRSLTHFEHRRSKGAAGGAGAATAGGADKTTPTHNRKVLDWGEDGKPIYEDGTVGGDEVPAADDADVNSVGQRELQAAADADDLWEERFGSHSDSKPNGPMSVGVDITFHGTTHVYGIPEHATSLALKSTNGASGGYTEPYRLYNLDVFEYELDVPMALYGSIPMMMSHSAEASTGVYWNNPTETYVDVEQSNGNTATRWISESGTWDLFLLPGPVAANVFSQYTGITGTQGLPPTFALGYHQCRWNYKDENDVFSVDSKFEEHNFPYDVLWLDIEHTDGKRYFTWDHHTFPSPAAMQEKLAARGRRMVTIVDPHIKRDLGYPVHKEATEKGLYIKTKSGTDLDGWCWPGSSSYLDFTSPDVRSWWSDRFSLENYKGSTNHLYTWNDMNEPSVFNGPEVTMDKDALSLAGIEHREWHNLYGFYQQWATAEGQMRRAEDKNTRPFVLSRAFFAGSQRFGAIWTGDNKADWEHLAASAPMLMSIGLAGLTFAGADVGGFFKNPDKELMTRWYQAGAYQPFFRAHAHIETSRREPWLFGDETLQHLRDSVRTRYSYLPLWSTLFYEAHTTGMPTMRPLWVEFPQDQDVFSLDDQWMVGSDLLVKPVAAPGVGVLSVYFPGSEPWYDTTTLKQVSMGGAASSVQTPIDKIPVFQRGGRIVTRRLRPRRCADLMANDPFTLVVALDTDGSSTGRLYLDDGISFNYQRAAEFSYRQFDFSSGVLRSSDASGGVGSYNPGVTVERVQILGVETAPTSVTVVNHAGASEAATFVYDASAQTLTVRKPNVQAALDFTITIA